MKLRRHMMFARILITMPSFIVKKGIIRKFLDFKNNRNGHIRYITDVTGESIGYCKQIVEVAQVS
jgi:hypothetical protein